MSYRIGKVTYHHFGPFEHAEFDFDYDGLTFIEGEVEGRTGCSSNGAGKSFLFDGVAWALYGRCVRPKYAKDEVIWDGASGDCYVRVEIKPDITITRYRKHAEFDNQVRVQVGGKDSTRHSTALTDLVIEKTLGMDYAAFANSVAFGAREDVQSFLGATDAARKKVLDTLLGLSVYQRAEEIAKKRTRKLAELVEENEGSVTIARTRLESHLEVMANIPTDEEVDELRFEATQAEVKAKRLAKARDKTKARIDKYTSERNELEATHSEARAKWKVACREIEEIKAQQRKHLRKADTEVSRYVAHIDVMNAQIAELRNVEGGDCPTCQQPVPKKHVAGIVKQLHNEIELQRNAQKAAQTERTEIEQRIEDSTLPDEPTPPAELDALQQEIEIEQDVLADQRHDAHAARNEADRLQEKLMDATADHDEAEKTREALEAELDKLTDALSGLEKELARLEFWCEGFGNRGLKSFLIEAELPHINKLASGYALRLLGDGTYIRLQAARQLKRGGTKEELTVDARIPGMTPTYAGASKGQKLRLDLSILMGFGDLVSHRAARSIDQMFADEIFDGVDAAGVQAIVELLQELAQAQPVIMVTHDPRLKYAGGRIVTVRHENDRAVLVSSEPAKRPRKTRKRLSQG